MTDCAPRRLTTGGCGAGIRRHEERPPRYLLFSGAARTDKSSSIHPVSTAGDRNHVFQIAASRNDHALSLATDIPDAWYASQALSAVLRYGPESRIETLSVRTQKRAAECADDYCRSAVLAWLIRALAERDRPDLARAVLTSALDIAARATPAGSRAEALCLLYQAAWPLGPQRIGPVIVRLIALHEQEPHWRCARAVVHALAIHSSVAPEDTERMLRPLHQRYPKLAARVRRAIALDLTAPRSFFQAH